jgi:hypothetical protein
MRIDFADTFWKLAFAASSCLLGAISEEIPGEITEEE